MSTLKVNTVESATTPTVLISDGLSVSGVSTLTGGLKVGTAITMSDNGNFGITGIMTASSFVAKNVGIGTDNPNKELEVHGSSDTCVRVISTAGGVASLQLGDTSDHIKGAITFKSDDNTLRIRGHNNADRMIINSSGQVGVNRDTDPLNGVKLMVQNGSGNVFYAYHEGTGNNYSILCRNDRAVSSTQATQIIFIGSGNVAVGDIRSTGSSTAYNTSSDYRLKENVTAISDGITRLKTLKPYRFNFKVDPSVTVDGFLAHEVTAVPEAISGTKDEVVTQAMIDNGDAPSDSKLDDPIYQQIDQAKLVPLLTAALQEEIVKREEIETKYNALEARISALEGS